MNESFQFFVFFFQLKYVLIKSHSVVSEVWRINNRLTQKQHYKVTVHVFSHTHTSVYCHLVARVRHCSPTLFFLCVCESSRPSCWSSSGSTSWGTTRLRWRQPDYQSASQDIVHCPGPSRPPPLPPSPWSSRSWRPSLDSPRVRWPYASPYDPSCCLPED